jgi:hypothetical protein
MNLVQLICNYKRLHHHQTMKPPHSRPCICAGISARNHGKHSKPQGLEPGYVDSRHSISYAIGVFIMFLIHGIRRFRLNNQD